MSGVLRNLHQTISEVLIAALIQDMALALIRPGPPEVTTRVILRRIVRDGPFAVLNGSKKCVPSHAMSLSAT